MSLKEKILADLKEAMKSGDDNKKTTLRMLSSAINNAAIEKKKKEDGLNDEEIVEVVARGIKSRRDSIEQYEKGGRPELAEKEKSEITILEAYMPEQLGEDEVRNIVKKAIENTGSSTKADMGKVMGAAMGQLKGKADGNLVKKVVEEELN